MTGFSTRELSHFDRLPGLCSPEGWERLMEAYKLALSEGRSVDTELPLHVRQKQSIWVRVVGDVEAGNQQSEQRLISMFQGSTGRKQLEQKLWTAATRDALTGAFNPTAGKMANRQIRMCAARHRERRAQGE